MLVLFSIAILLFTCILLFLISVISYKNTNKRDEKDKCYAYACESRFLAQLEKQEFNIGVYETELPLYDESICRFGNIKDGSGEFESIYALMRLELKLVGFKYAPFNLKKYCQSSCIHSIQ